jgi:Uma2 family endonuclease
MAHTSTHHAKEGPFTWEDFIALEEDDLRELIDGELVEVEVPGFNHERIVGALVVSLGLWSRTHGGVVLPSGFKVKITNKRGVMPDVQFFHKDNLPPDEMELGLAEGRPDLAIEVVSKSSRSYDRVTKLAWYASIGVPEYWLVDPRSATVERMVLRGGTYETTDTLRDAGILRPETFDGLEIDLADLWGAPTP